MVSSMLCVAICVLVLIGHLPCTILARMVVQRTVATDILRYIKGTCRSRYTEDIDHVLMQDLFNAHAKFIANPIYARSALGIESFPLGKLGYLMPHLPWRSLDLLASIMIKGSHTSFRRRYARFYQMPQLSRVERAPII